MLHNCRKLELHFFLCAAQTTTSGGGSVCVRVCAFVYVSAYQNREYVTHTQRITHCLLRRRTLRMSDVLVSCLFNFLLMSCLSFVAATADAASFLSVLLLFLLLQLSLLFLLLF